MNALRISTELAAVLDLQPIAAAAAIRGNDFFPSRIAFRAAEESDEFRKSLGRKWSSGFDMARPEFVVVPKGGGGTRPGCDLDVGSRLLFDALNQAIRAAIEPGLVNWSLTGKDRTDAEDRLRRGTHTHVLVTDVVAFYEYIDRQVLQDELADLSGLDEAVIALAELLDALMPRSVGIPQGSPSAGLLADVYLSIVDRVLARANIRVVRWADDYRFAASDLRHAFRIRTLLEPALREMGLVASSSKTWTPTRQTYAKWVSDQRAERTQIDAVKARIDERRTEDYATDADDDEGQPKRKIEPDQVLQDGFATDTSEEAAWGSSPDAYATGRRIQVSLRELGRTGSTIPLERMSPLLYRHPHLTKQIAGYLRARIHGGWERDTVDAISSVIRDQDVPFQWQLGWLMHALVPTAARLPKGAIDGAASALSSPGVPGFIRGRAALVLAREGKLPAGAEFAEVFEQASEASRPDLVAAAAIEGRPDLRQFLKSIRRDPLLRQIADRAPETNEYYL
jgi:hypothetical protein